MHCKYILLWHYGGDYCKVVLGHEFIVLDNCAVADTVAIKCGVMFLLAVNDIDKAKCDVFE